MLAAPARDLSGSWSLVERTIGRPLRRAEQAIDVLRLDQALNDGKDDLEAAIRAEMLRAVLAWLDGGILALQVTDRMLKVIDRLRKLGREEALLELKRLGYGDAKSSSSTSQRSLAVDPVEPVAGRDLYTYLRRNLPSIQARIELDLVTTDLAGAAISAVEQALLRIPGARDIASRVVSVALIDGMAQTWEANEDIVGGWEYTAVLDPGTCEECEPLDGTVYDTIAELFVVLPDFGPNPECLGGSRCRCRAVPVAP